MTAYVPMPDHQRERVPLMRDITRIVEAEPDGEWTAMGLASLVYGVDTPTQGQRNKVYRAVGVLVKRGVLVKGKAPRGHGLGSYPAPLWSAQRRRT